MEEDLTEEGHEKSCKNCSHYHRNSVGTPGFSHHDWWWECDITNSWHLPNWPFENGCMHFELDPYLRDDFDK